MSAATDCRCGEPAAGRCAYCRRPVCLDCADAHDAQCQKRPATYGPLCHAPYNGPYRVEWCGLSPGHYPTTPHGPRAKVIPGAVGATEDAL